MGSTIEDCTKGAWVWGNYREKQGGKAKILFIDSEALASKDFDARIFTLLTLISSLFIYNTTSNIDDQGISELVLATQLASSISTNSKVDKDAFVTENAPKFLWITRDFTLEKVHPETNKEISSKEYLDIYLRKKNPSSKGEVNNIRDAIIKYFPERDCVTLVSPVDEESMLKNLNTNSPDELKQDFQEEFTILKNKIFKELSSKRIKGKKFNGCSLANFIEEWVNDINKGSQPNISNIWDVIIDKDIVDFYQKAFKSYTININNLKEVKEQDELIKMLYEFKLEAMMLYNKIFRF